MQDILQLYRQVAAATAGPPGTATPHMHALSAVPPSTAGTGVSTPGAPVATPTPLYQVPPVVQWHAGTGACVTPSGAHASAHAFNGPALVTGTPAVPSDLTHGGDARHSAPVGAKELLGVASGTPIGAHGAWQPPVAVGVVPHDPSMHAAAAAVPLKLSADAKYSTAIGKAAGATPRSSFPFPACDVDVGTLRGCVHRHAIGRFGAFQKRWLVLQGMTREYCSHFSSCSPPPPLPHSALLHPSARHWAAESHHDRSGPRRNAAAP